MGNQPSAPPSPPPPTAPSPPPLPPPCDMECEKQKNLALLKSALDNADPVNDPDGYEKARIAYYTLLNGQGWLQTEKQRIAKEDVEPVISTYNTKFKALKGEKQSQSIFMNLANGLKAQEGADKQDSVFLKKQMNAEKDKAEVLNRLNELNVGTPVTPPPVDPLASYVTILIDILIAVLGIGILYLGYMKLPVIENLLGFKSNSVTGSIQ